MNIKKITAVITGAVMTISAVILPELQTKIKAEGENYSEFIQYNDDIKYRKVDENSDNVYDYAEISTSNRSVVSVEIPSEIEGLPVTHIGGIGFIECRSLVSVSIPDSITVIENNAFSQCSSLESIDISENVTEIGAYVFGNCSSLKSINVSEKNKNYCDVDGVLFSKNKSRLIQYPAASAGEKYDIPNGVQNIDGLSFSGCSNLKEITVPESMHIINYMGFADCFSIEKITIPDGIFLISVDAFRGCANLKEINIPKSVTEIESGAFGKCSSLKSVTVPEKVEKIGNGAFMHCDSLESITILNPECQIYDSNSTICGNYRIGMSSDPTVCGYNNSTAQSYAQKYGLEFRSIGDYDPAVTTTSPTSQGTTTTTTVITSVTTNESILWGDISRNNKIDLQDAIIIAKYLLGSVKFTDEEKNIADYNRDGNIDLYDVIGIAKYLLK